MDDKTEYLTYWGYALGTPEAEKAWADKLEMMRNPQKAPMGFVSRDVCYDSPIDGRAITNAHSRREDLKRAGCVEYDPGMKQDAVRVAAEKDAALDKSVDTYVEREFSQMPSRKLEKLSAELSAGVAADVVRQTPERSA